MTDEDNNAHERRAYTIAGWHLTTYIIIDQCICLDGADVVYNTFNKMCLSACDLSSIDGIWEYSIYEDPSANICIKWNLYMITFLLAAPKCF